MLRSSWSLSYRLLTCFLCCFHGSSEFPYSFPLQSNSLTWWSLPSRSETSFRLYASGILLLFFLHHRFFIFRMKLLLNIVCLSSLSPNPFVSRFLQTRLPLKSTSVQNRLYFRNSDFYVKCFSYLFRCISGVVQNNPASGDLSLDIQIVSLYTSLLPYLSHFTFFPLLMKTVFETSLFVCNQHVRGFEELSYYALNEFFSFMISSFDRFE